MLKKKNVIKHLKQFLVWYAIAIVLLMIFIIVILFTNDYEDAKKFKTFIRIVEIFIQNKLTYFVLTIPYLIFVFIRSFVRDYQKQKIKGLLKGIGLKLLLPILLIWGSLKSIDVYRQSEHFNYLWDYSIENTSPTIRDLYALDNKQRGFHIFGWTDYSEAFETLKNPTKEQIEQHNNDIKDIQNKIDSTFEVTKTIDEPSYRLDESKYQYKYSNQYEWLNNTQDARKI